MLRLLLIFTCLTALHAQEAAPREDVAPIAEQPTPFSVWLDIPVLSRPNAPQPELPIWFESFQTEPVVATDTTPPRMIYRLRLRRTPSLHHEILLRVFFDDLPEMQPVITAWSETGKERFRSEALGSGTALPSSETVILPVDGTDYVDISVAGNGSNIRGAFASSLKDVTTRQAQDFQPVPEVAEPFGALPLAQPATEDTKLYGRVSATLDEDIVLLSPKGVVSETWEFDLAAQPLVALVTFDVLNADLTATPIVLANEGEPIAATIHWPDLADPGFRGESRALEPSMRFQYTGWLRAQAVIPAHLLRSGLNKVLISLSDDSGPIAVRNVSLQLKQNWKHFDYILSPVHP